MHQKFKLIDGSMILKHMLLELQLLIEQMQRRMTNTMATYQGMMNLMRISEFLSILRSFGSMIFISINGTEA